MLMHAQFISLLIYKSRQLNDLLIGSPIMEDFESKRFSAGYRLAHPGVGEDIVISGISGQFPNSHNTKHYFQNLLDKVDLCDEDERRHKHVDPEIPRNTGKIYDAEKCDSGFFGIHPRHSDGMDPQTRLLLERSFEAILDAGLNPRELEGSSTGVFVGSCYCESQKNVFFMQEHPKRNAVAGQSKSMQAQNITYFLKLNGPSFACDTACSSGMFAFEQAYKAIRSGTCDRALVAASNLVFHPKTTLQFKRLGVLNLNDVCRSFDENAKGYTRSEAIAVLILQKSKEAKRIYTEIIHCKTNVDGFKADGITFPSAEMQTQLARTVSEECGVPVEEVCFVEAHGTGTKAGDTVELNVINTVYCTETSRKPLLVGSVKGNIGHGEPTAGINSIIKVLLSMESGVIPPNIHFEIPRAGVEGLINGNLKVVTEVTAWPSWSDLAVVNCFGFGGANGMVLLKRHRKHATIPDDGLPRLICLSGTTLEALTNIQDYLRNNKLNYEYVRLLQDAFGKHIVNHTYRGYSIICKRGEITRSIQEAPNFKRKPLYLCIGTQNRYPTTLIAEMQKIAIFRNSNESINRILKRNEIDIVVTSNVDIKNALDQAMLSASVQIGLVDLLNFMGIRPDCIVSNSMGSIIAAYADGGLTMEETVLAVYRLNKAMMELKNLKEFPNTIQKELKAIIKPKTLKSLKYSVEYFLSKILNSNYQCPLKRLASKSITVLNIDYYIPNEIDKCIDLVNPRMNVTEFLCKIGSLYELGYEPQIWMLYPKIEWPVSTGTPNISSLIKWNHKRDHYLPKMIEDTKVLGEFKTTFNIDNPNYSYLKGHVIDGRILFPATGYLVFVWQKLASNAGIDLEKSTVQFENVKFLKATIFTKTVVAIELHLNIGRDGFFEISENNETVVNGYAWCSLNRPTFKIPEYSTSNEPKLLHKDIYKLLRINGYQYKDQFCALQEYADTKGLIKWADNWETFLDNMFQFLVLDIVQKSKALYVPTGLSKLIINADEHLKHVEMLEENEFVPVFLEEKCKILRSKFVELIGLEASPIPTKQQALQPILESYEFVPNEATLTIAESARVNLQIIIENLTTLSVNFAEYVKDQSSLTTHIIRAVEDVPLVQPEFKIFSSKVADFEVQGAEMLIGDIDKDHGDVFVVHNILNNSKILEKALQSMTTKGFLIAVENETVSQIPDELISLTTHKVGNIVIYLLRKKQNIANPKVIRLNQNLDWITEAQNALENATSVIVCSENEPLQGTLGLVNCLRREPGGEKISCFHLEGAGITFDVNNNFYSNQLCKNMSINVYKNGRWGTFRHKTIEKVDHITGDHSFADVLQKGDLSTLQWMMGPKEISNDSIKVHFSAINFRDIMVATGKINLQPKDSVEEACLLGLEYSGISSSGERVMGITKGGAISTLVKHDLDLCWPIPAHWSMQEAATVPIVYSTVLLALIIKANIKPGQSILIHSGTGGIGLAAINVALHYKMIIFTTIGTEEKRDFLKKHFPQIRESRIASSRDTRFEQMIHRETEGRGVDIVLNSLAEEKLTASVRCLAKGGTFLEIGKFDLIKNNSVSAELMNRQASYHGVMLDHMMETDLKRFANLKELMNCGIENKFVKPLPSLCFEMEQLEEAFRFMGTGKHIGKVLLRIRKDEKESGLSSTFLSAPRYYFNPLASYIILGGLGGVGIELAGWLIKRGARNIVMTSRNGPKTSYQTYFLAKWKKRGINVRMMLHDSSTEVGCKALIEEADRVAPVEGIFNLAVQLRDGMFQNLTAEDFEISLKAKGRATRLLDTLTRKLCPHLKYFVVFSSVSSGKGNAGQSNYGYSNSIMERICEQRRTDGLPALAIQWGAIGDVGLVAAMQVDGRELVITGTIPQKISSCLGVLDTLLSQKSAVVSSMVIAEKDSLSNKHNGLVDSVLSIFGIKDIKVVNHYATFPELGMDSMMAVEIKQLLERDYDIFVTPQHIKTMTIANLTEIEENLSERKEEIEVKDDNFDKLFSALYRENTYSLKQVQFNLDKFIGNEHLFGFPGVEGIYDGLNTILQTLQQPSTCFQYVSRDIGSSSEQFIDGFCEEIKTTSTTKTFNIIAHSLGSIVALETAARLELEGYLGKIVIMDGSPELMKSLIKLTLGNATEEEFEIYVLLKVVNHFTPITRANVNSIMGEMITKISRRDRIETLLGHFEELGRIDRTMLDDVFNFVVDFLRFLKNYDAKELLVKSEVLLIKPSMPLLADFAVDLRLSKQCVNIKDVKEFQGNHTNFFNNPEAVAEITNFLK